MYVEKLKNGHYKFVERFTDPLSGKARKVSIVLEKNNAQARRDAMKTLMAKIEEKSSVIIKPQEMTLGDLVDAYRGRQSELVKSTQHRNSIEAKFWEKLLGRETLLSVLPHLNILAMMEKTGRTPEYLNNRLERFKAMVSWGYAEGFLESAEFLNRLRRFHCPPHRDRIADKFLEVEEYRRLVPEIDIVKWQLVTKFMVLSGMRFGEVAALDTKDVDFEEGVIHVNKTWNQMNGEPTHAKSLSSIRDIHMQPQLLALAREVDAYMLPRRLISKSRFFFFVDDDGGRLHHPAFCKALKKHSLEVLGREVTPHTLRHTSASFMFAQGFTENEVQRRLGHSNSRITRQIYIHVIKELQERDNRHLDTFVV